MVNAPYHFPSLMHMACACLLLDKDPAHTRIHYLCSTNLPSECGVLTHVSPLVAGCSPTTLAVC